MGTQRKKPFVHPGDVVAAALGLDPAVWSVSASYSKKFLSGNRTGSVEVVHRPTGRERRAEFFSGGKAAARRDAVAVARRLVEELRHG
jgi:hypothetical protein